MVKADIETINCEEKNRVLLCSDGLTNKIPDEEIEQFLRNTENIDELAKEFIHVANERGGEDNITLAIIQKAEQHQVGDSSC